MLARPAGVEDADVAAALREHWSIAADRVDYAPVGFGSHHWLTATHFVTVDAAGDRDELVPALRTAQALRDDAGLEFVIAPIAATDGELVAPLLHEWLLHVYERLDVVDDTMFGPHDDPEVVQLVRTIHAHTGVAARHARCEDFAIWDRDDLEEALDDLDEPWETGPYGDRARALLIRHAADVDRLLVAHDRLACAVPSDGWVVTHGEPHRGNVFRTTRGWAMVDWDTALVAPPERDLWDLGGGGGDPTLCELYRLRWDLGEIAVCIADLYDEHPGDANDAQTWESLVTHLDPRRRWPHLVTP